MNMGIRLVLFLSLAFLTRPSFCNEKQYPGSNGAGMGNAMVANHGFWSIFHNQAGLANLQGTNFGFHRENRFLVSEYALSAIALAVPTKPGTLGLGLSYFGYSNYHEINSGLSFSRKMTERIAFGVQLNFHHLHISEHYGNTQHLSVEGGMIAMPVQDFYIGVHVFNPTRASIRTFYEQASPLIMRFGMAYHVGNRAILGIETEKESEQKAIFRAGTELMVIEQLVIRAGINVRPVQSSFGIGYRNAGLLIDLAFTNHPVLGLTPHFSTSIAFQ
jgi:hypothetical protein